MVGVSVCLYRSTGLGRNCIPCRPRDLETRRIPFEAFRDFYQHFLYDHNCFQFFKLGVDYFTSVVTQRFVVFYSSNEVLFTFSVMVMSLNTVYVMEVAAMREKSISCVLHILSDDVLKLFGD